jgi:hypothetical protein
VACCTEEQISNIGERNYQKVTELSFASTTLLALVLMGR